MAQLLPKRNTAYKFWIKDLLNAVPISQGGLHVFDIRGREALRVNIIAAVVDKTTNEEKTFSSITLDDGTETVRVKTWNEDVKKLENISIGDPVMIIGKISLYGNELSIRPEIVKKQEPEWLLVRKKELEKIYGKPEEPKEKTLTEDTPPHEVTEEVVVSGPTITARQRILDFVEKETAKEGIETTRLIRLSGLKEEEAEKAIDELLREGELFQPRTGFLKII
ncbi:MAG: OB-fold nucleic acid binding domain-containing protein [Nanoarchaeota archaeon]|nr:OB-fold nucleic acid binding domain-containing protein [Nanoarchaeota archaeon]